ncbi:hypothetical protein ACFQYP_32840 [Nonomuraea antimicrobica]
MAAGDHGMLVCRPLTERATRGDVRYLGIDGLDEASQMGLVWRKDRESWQLTTLAGLLDAEFVRSVDATKRIAV